MTVEQRAARTFGQVVAICPGGLEAITAALREAIAEEREAIAQFVETYREGEWQQYPGCEASESEGQACCLLKLAERIRARANPPGPTTPPPAEGESPPRAGSPPRP